MQFIYNIGIASYGALIHVAALFSAKAKKWVLGRKNWEANLRDFRRTEQNLYWFHCASLGEFEQGRPIMETLKTNENCQLVVSFFSPSGYDIRKDYDKADLVFYLPLDKVSNAKKLIEILKPTKVFIVKYEFWANLISTLKKHSIPIYLVSGTFRKKQRFFKWYGKFFRNVLKHFTTIFVQNSASLELLNAIKIDAVLTGDTRYDRVMSNSKHAKKIGLVEAFFDGKKAFVIGSSWIADDQVLMPLINSKTFNSKVIIAPHEVSEHRIQQIEKQLNKPFKRFSNYGGEEDYEVLIIDNIGMLMHLYQYANVAYVGGGFKTGLHNILEPASFGVPVIFGPEHGKFPEAELFIENNIGCEIDSSEKLASAYNRLASLDSYDTIKSFMVGQTGATEIILKHLNAK